MRLCMGGIGVPLNEELFREILKRTEDETLDFKAQMYDFNTGRADFLKDLLCLANTPRPASAYLVLGVDWAPGRPAVASGMDQQVDDAKLRGLLTGDMVTPVAPDLLLSSASYQWTTLRGH